MFSIFKRKQQYVNIFMSVTFNRDGVTLGDCGIAKVRWPVNIDDLEKIADNVASRNNKSYTNISIASICIISNVYR